jgi:hypothetical protein
VSEGFVELQVFFLIQSWLIDDVYGPILVVDDVVVDICVVCKFQK